MNSLTKLLTVAALALPALVSAQSPADFAGRWTIDSQQSTALDPWRSLELEIGVNGDSVTIIRHYKAGSRVADESMALDTSLPSQTVKTEGWWDNRHIGAYLGNGGEQTVSAKWLDEGRTLQLNIDLVLETSQGDTPVRVIREMRLSDDGQRLTAVQMRSSRNLPIVRVFNRTEG